MAVFMLLLPALSLKAQLVGPTMTGTPAAGSYYNYSSITLTDFGFTASAGNSLQLYIANPDCQLLSTAASANRNYILTSVPRTAITDQNSLAGRGTCDLMQTVQYIDGLGRPLQTIQVKGSPLGNDIVQSIAYDQYGRKAQKYLPYAATTNDGSFKADAFTPGAGVSKFYNPTGNGVSGTQQVNGIVVNPLPFAQTGFEPSPLNRVIEQGAPGTPWQVVTGGTGHTVKITYTNNNGNSYTADPVNGSKAALYNVTINAADQSRMLVPNGYYTAGMLYVTITKDENWVSGRAGTTEEYKDEDGRAVLKRVYSADSAQPVLSTYYVYDDLGNLAFILPPAANGDAAATISQPTLDNYCYQYRYDGRNRLTEKKIPGKGWEFMVYNALDQITFTQDANQRSQNPQVWTYMQYDAMGREVITGIWSSLGATGSAADPNISTPSRVLEQWLVNWQAGQTILWLTRDNSTATGYAAINPQGTLLTVNYYDDYNFPGNPYTSFTGSLIPPTGLLTGTKTAILNSDGTIGSMLWGVHGYDGFGRETLTIKQHYQGGQPAYNTGNYDITTSTYNFDNQIAHTSRAHIVSPGSTPKIGIGTQYYYDHMGRQTQIWKVVWDESLTQPGGTLISQADYNEIGQLKTKHLHSENSGSSFLQDVPYTYNERGWISAAGASSNLFSFGLRYNSPDAGVTPEFNGNISEMLYLGVHSGSKSFNYTYDPLNRLTDAASTSNLLNEHIGYNMMGNITALTRTGGSPAVLAYIYYNGNQSNQLQTVTNNGTAYKSYTYDNNGNATSDGNTVSKTINYNLLNLPRTVTNGATPLASYTYDATGHKLQNTGSDGTWDYIDGIVVNNFSGTITQFVQTEEGRAVLQGTTYHYEYNLKDHLGNVRASFDKDPTTGNAREIQEDEYYSFGLRKTGGYDFSNHNRFLYNGKEVQTDLTNQYDYGARFYDPVVGRWATVDPHASSYVSISPYSYVSSNPITSIDPDGRDLIVLNATSHVFGAGHAAVLIGNSKTGYKYYAKNGTTKNFGTHGKSDVSPEKGAKVFKTLKDFENSQENKRDGPYDRTYEIKTDEATDKKMEAAAKEAVESDYNVLDQSCIDVASDALSAGKLDPGYDKSYNPEMDMDRITMSRIPNWRFDSIVRNNPGGHLRVFVEGAPKKERKGTVTAEPLSKPTFLPNDPPK